MDRKFTCVEDIWARSPNKYLAVIIIAKKARAINQQYVDAIKMEEAIGNIMDHPIRRPISSAYKEFLEKETLTTENE